MLNISNVYKSYGEKEVLKGVSFKVNAGEIVGLIGENGSGKTTLIKTILGSVIADSGVIQFKEKDNYISDSFSMKEIGYLLDIDLIQELNAVELLKLYSLYENKGYNLKKTEEALQEFKLPRDSKIKEYSYGMQQRLRLLLALDETRQLLILDEPLLGLDITSIDLMKKV
ncbi:ATP-binding cassette domain-containing protein [Dolosicoccus paucivorans]|uniref:ABC transporter domain-containing protein n=1 Tax=Dolosicoccus paucivorans TaxID=84521 RepID=A0A1G8KW33_9LACT|nr:ATP-binding cassette domain-containing protein [Dolosicoccus paucivorans]PMB84235.1 hypothetical protein CJ206_04840 [Dolosicoccus paucivorans]PMC58519.1 hypothetical protein CJ205_04050 [Dolosicoccus paucivorans]SDI47557.1 ABC transporter [Dolosicoccus paucivorans]